MNKRNKLRICKPQAFMKTTHSRLGIKFMENLTYLKIAKKFFEFITRW